MMATFIASLGSRVSPFTTPMVLLRIATVRTPRKLQIRALNTSTSRPNSPKLVTCTPNDLPALVDTATDAFLNDPALRWLYTPICSTENEYEQAIRNVNQARISSALANSQGATVYSDEQKRAVAIVYRPGKFNMLDTTWRLFLAIGPVKFVHMMRMVYRCAIGAPKEPYVYLFMIACGRDSQGTGLGSALMKQVIRKSEETGIGAYLESSNPANLEFYMKRETWF